MAVCEIHYQSKALQKQTGLIVILPDEMPTTALPVVYQLHGLSDAYSTWQRRTAIERHVQQHQMMVVCPDGGRGWYSNACTSFGNFEDHIIETISWVEGTFRTRTDRGGRAIGGLSMGGYGAMKIGLKYPQFFTSIASHSGALDINDPDNRNRWAEYDLIYGDRAPAADDCFLLAEASNDDRPAIRFDCGTDDFLIDHNRRFHAHLDKLGIEHLYEEHPGAHTWDYWDTHVQAALAFHTDRFTSAG